MKFTNHNVRISPKATIGKGVRIGDNTVIYDNVIIGENSTICNDCIIGEPLSDYYSEIDYIQPTTVIGANALVRSHTMIYAGCVIGSHFETGHHAIIREHSTIGNHCIVGTFSDVQGHVIMGNYTRLHSSVHLAKGSVLGDFVFIYPFAVLTNDRFPPSLETTAPTIGDYTQICVSAVILPGVQIGANCLIGTNATVSDDVEDFSLMLGSPAKRKGDVRELKAEDGAPLYPWNRRFDRGMPWTNAI